MNGDAVITVLILVLTMLFGGCAGWFKSMECATAGFLSGAALAGWSLNVFVVERRERIEAEPRAEETGHANTWQD